MLDAMGNGSPISKQIRGSVEPDGVCIVVGSCASGYNAANNTYSDVIYTGKITIPYTVYSVWTTQSFKLLNDFCFSTKIVKFCVLTPPPSRHTHHVKG